MKFLSLKKIGFSLALGLFALSFSPDTNAVSVGDIESAVENAGSAKGCGELISVLNSCHSHIYCRTPLKLKCNIPFSAKTGQFCSLDQLNSLVTASYCYDSLDAALDANPNFQAAACTAGNVPSDYANCPSS